MKIARCLTLVAALVPGVAAAQQVPTDPASTHIFPAGGQRGTIVAVRVGGECFPPRTRFRVFGEGLSGSELLLDRAPVREEPSPRRKPAETHINYPKEWEATIEIAADAPPGQALWRVSCARGGTAARPFIVGDLPEFIETESNSLPERAEAIELPVVVNGQIAGERDVDYFRIPVRAGQVITADVAAARLGSPLEARVEFRDAAGRRLDTKVARAGSDPVLAFRVPADGEYRLSVAHLGEQGGPHYVYRITLSAEPFVRFAFPPGGKAGSTVAVEWFTLVDDAASAWTELVAMPSQSGREVRLRPAGRGSMNQVLMACGDCDEVVEAEPNDTHDAALPVRAPVTINGRLDPASDEDWIRFTTGAAERWLIECRALPEGSDCLPVVSVLDAAGNALAQAARVDDLSKPVRIEWQVPAAGEYFIRTRDTQQGVAGGPDFLYRLTVRPAEPDFSLTAAADFVNVVQGALAELEVRATRSGGFAESIALRVTGLPEGVRCETTPIAAGQDTAKLSFQAAADAPSGDWNLRIEGTAAIGSISATRTAVAPHLGADAEGLSLGDRFVDHVQLTVRHKPLFRLYCSEAYQYAYRGTIYPYLMEVERFDGFDGPIRLQIADRQIKDLDGAGVLECTIEPGQNQIMLPIYLPESMHINVQAHSNIYAQAYALFDDAHGQPQSYLAVSEMRCMIRPLPGVVKLEAGESSLAAAPGQSVTCPMRLARSTNFSGAMRVELAEPAVEAGFAAEPIEIGAGLETGDVVVHIAEDAPRGTTTLKFRAVGELPGYASVISEASLTLAVE